VGLRGCLSGLARFLAGALAVVFIVLLPVSIVAFDVGRVIFSPAHMADLVSQSFNEAGGFRRLAMDAIAGGLQSEPGSVEGSGLNLKTALSFLTQQERDYLAEKLFPAEWVDTQLRSAFSDAYAWIDDDLARPNVRIDLRPVKETLRQGGADELVEVVVDSWPPCTVDQVAQMAGRIFGLSEGFPFCEPPEPLRSGMIGLAGEAIKLGVYALPDQMSLSADSAARKADPEMMQAKENVRLARTFSLMGWLLPPAVLLLILLLAIRSWRGLAWGWGVPLMAGGLLTVLAAVALRVTGGSVVAGMAAGSGLPAILADLFRRTAMTGVTSTLRLVGLHGGLALLVGVAVFGVARPLARRAERRAPARAAATRAEARTRILPIEHPHDEGDPPSGMFG